VLTWPSRRAPESLVPPCNPHRLAVMPMPAVAASTCSAVFWPSNRMKRRALAGRKQGRPLFERFLSSFRFCEFHEWHFRTAGLHPLNERGHQAPSCTPIRETLIWLRWQQCAAGAAAGAETRGSRSCHCASRQRRASHHSCQYLHPCSGCTKPGPANSAKPTAIFHIPLPSKKSSRSGEPESPGLETGALTHFTRKNQSLA